MAKALKAKLSWMMSLKRFKSMNFNSSSVLKKRPAMQPVNDQMGWKYLQILLFDEFN